MEVSTYTAINLIIDFLLMIGLSYYVPRHAPKLFILLVALNLSQYFIHIPLEKVAGLSNYPERQGDVFKTLEVLRATRDNFDQTARALGADTSALPAPEFKVPDFKSLLDPRSPVQQAVKMLEPEFKEAMNEEPRTRKEQEAHELKVWNDPYALWLFTRVFWFAAAAILFIQRPSLGASVLAFQIIPFPFLAFAVPYLYFWFQDLRWVRAVEGALEEPERAQEFISPEGLGVTVMVFAGLLMLMVCFTLIVLARRTSPKARLERKFLNPERYLVRINGNLLPFTVEGHFLEVQGIRLNCREVAVFPEKPNKWMLGSSTIVEFVEKS